MSSRTGPPQRCCGFPQFCRAQERACARRLFLTPDKIGSPAPRCAAPPASLTRPGMTPAFRLSTRKETTMITLYDHIQELRAELRGLPLHAPRTRHRAGGAGEGRRRASRARPRLRQRPRGAAQPGRGYRGRRVSGPLPSPAAVAVSAASGRCAPIHVVSRPAFPRTASGHSSAVGCRWCPLPGRPPRTSISCGPWSAPRRFRTRSATSARCPRFSVGALPAKRVIPLRASPFRRRGPALRTDRIEAPLCRPLSRGTPVKS